MARIRDANYDDINKEILEYIIDYSQRTRGVFPTFAEIKDNTPAASKSRVTAHLKTLIESGDVIKIAVDGKEHYRLTRGVWFYVPRDILSFDADGDKERLTLEINNDTYSEPVSTMNFKYK